ncbi:tRNA-dihydrouridine synthase [Candidatus Pacearchaeota archaeon]|nr:tRNA-dihydrouridine synthase [Candidatus Pacearchaeota archaeon]
MALKIGNIKLKNRLFLAPMVEVTDCAYRLLCRSEGAAMAYTEMIYVDAILHENSRTQGLMKIAGKKDRPVGLQVTGNNLSEFTKFSKLKILEDYDLIDINCGCPSSRIVGNEAGSYLLRTPDKIGDMIKVLKDTGRIVTAKIRLGFKNNNVLQVSKVVEKAGADLLTIHARTADQKYTDAPDWNWISKVKREIGIPVVGNGGIVSGESASKMLDICDGAMVASAAIGNPFIFREILRYLKTGKENEITKKDRIDGFSEYVKLAEKNEVFEMSRVKYIGSNFFKSFEGASQARVNLMKCKSIKDVKEMLNSL